VLASDFALEIEVRRKRGRTPRARPKIMLMRKMTAAAITIMAPAGSLGRRAETEAPSHPETAPMMAASQSMCRRLLVQKRAAVAWSDEEGDDED
jgi:hypothetical protein